MWKTNRKHLDQVKEKKMNLYLLTVCRITQWHELETNTDRVLARLCLSLIPISQNSQSWLVIDWITSRPTDLSYPIIYVLGTVIQYTYSHTYCRGHLKKHIIRVSQKIYYPILERVSTFLLLLLLLRHAQATPPEIWTGLTWELWSKTNLLNWHN